MAPLITLEGPQQRTAVLAGAAAAAALATYKLLSSGAPSKLKSTREDKDDCWLNPSAELFALQAFTRLCAAFGSDGLNAPGTGSGAMIASPSRPGDRLNKELENDNYFFQWPRDSGICVRMLVRRWARALDGRQVGMPGGRDWLAGALRRNRNGIVSPNTYADSAAAAAAAVARKPSLRPHKDRSGDSAAEIEKIIHDFVRMNLHLQSLENTSGTIETGGLGEPKFEVDGTPFNADWGRPQQDGPALRSLSMLAYATQVLMLVDPTHPSYKFVFDKLYPVPRGNTPAGVEKKHCLIDTDLDYICRTWRESGYEPWEEVNAGAPDGEIGGHAYVLMVQRQALLCGARFASNVGDSSSAQQWKLCADEIGAALEHFWNPSGLLGLEGNGDDGPLSEDAWNDPRRHLQTVPQELLHRPHVVPTLHRRNGQPKPLQADVQTLLAFTHGGDGTWYELPAAADGDESPWTPWSDRCLATLDRLVEIFSIVYEVNAGKSTTHDGVLCGRYPEDVYDGKQQSVGHAWYLCTHAVVEVISLAANRFSTVGSFTPTQHSVKFFRRFHPTLQPELAYRKALDAEFEVVLRGMRAMAHAYLRTARSFAGPEGRMDEQIDRVSGQMRGARELTWSYASLLSAWDAVQREGCDVMEK